jgi:hypothetical protein
MVTEQIPAGTLAALGVKPGVVNDNVVGAAPAGPEPATSATTPSSAVAATPPPATAKRTRTGIR